MPSKFPLHIRGQFSYKPNFTHSSRHLLKGQFGQVGVAFLLVEENVTEFVRTEVVVDGDEGKGVNGEWGVAGGERGGFRLLLFVMFSCSIESQ